MWSCFVGWYWGVVSWGWFVRLRWSMISRGLVDWLVGVITWSSFVCYFNNVTRVVIDSIVLYMLSTAIWKDNAVFTIGRVTVTGFVSTKVYSSIFVRNSIFVLVFWWGISVGWLVIGWSVLGGMVRRSGMIGWSWPVYWSWVVDRGWVAWCSNRNCQKSNKGYEGLKNKVNF